MNRFDDIMIDGQENLPSYELLHRRIVFVFKNNTAIGICFKDFQILISNIDLFNIIEPVSDIKILITGLYAYIDKKPIYVFNENKLPVGHYFDDALLVLK